MSSVTKRAPGGCCCVAVATLTLTAWKFCSFGVGHTLFPGLLIGVTNGTTTVSGTTNGSGVVVLSLPSTGSWSPILPSPPAGYVAGGMGSFTIVAGANAKNAVPQIDLSNSWICEDATCGDPVHGPFTVAGTLYVPGGTSTAISLSTLAGDAGNTGIFTIGTFGGTTWYGRISGALGTLLVEWGTSPTLSGTTFSQNVVKSSFACGGTATYPVGAPTHFAFEGTIHP